MPLLMAETEWEAEELADQQGLEVWEGVPTWEAAEGSECFQTGQQELLEDLGSHLAQEDLHSRQ